MKQRKRLIMAKDSEGNICTYKRYNPRFAPVSSRVEKRNGNVLSIWEADGFGWVVSTVTGRLNICPNPEDLEELVREFFNIPEGQDIPVVMVSAAQMNKIIVPNTKPGLNCPVCGSAKTTKHGTQIRLWGKLKRRLCSECGHVWIAEKIPNPEPVIALVQDATVRAERTEEQRVIA